MNRFEKLYETAMIPTRSTRTAAGYDLYAHDEAIIKPKERKLIRLGVACELNTNCYLEVVPRSGLALKKGITLLNSPGIIDSDYYPNEIGAILFNSGDEDFEVKIGDRIAQGILREYYLMENDQVINKERTSGFGSTGV